MAKRQGVTGREGIAMLLTGIFGVIFIYFVAYAVPGAFIALSTVAWTSVNTGVVAIITVLFLLIAAFFFLLVLLSPLVKLLE